ncbi:MAG: DUF1592 domain-containing protein [Pirellulaceae bacterium]
MLVVSVVVATISTGRCADEPTDSSVSKSAASAKKQASTDGIPTLQEVRLKGYERTRFKDLSGHIASGNGESPDGKASKETQLPQANLDGFHSTIKPILLRNCVDCHGPDASEGNIRIDTLDPNLITGNDTDWWMEVLAVLSKGEMPPPDSGELADEERRKIVDWLATELQTASVVHRNSNAQSAFRRLTRYEYNYALQDLLGLPWDFAKDLPPESYSEDGFENSSELLHLSVSQFETYHRLARNALRRATVRGERPTTHYWGVSMEEAAAREWKQQDAQIEKAKKDLADDPDKLGAEIDRLEKSFHQQHRTAYFKKLSSGRTAAAEWQYYGAKYAFAPTDNRPEFPEAFDCVAVLPAVRQHRLVVELGNQLPDEGTMRVTVRASRMNTDSDYLPSMHLLFGWQASNEGRALLRVSEDVQVTGTADQPQIIEWDVPLGEIYPRNSVRKTSPMGVTPSPSEYIRLANSSASPADIQIDFVRVEAPVYDQWPPESHQRIFFKSESSNNEHAYAKRMIAAFAQRAWRRPITQNEIDRKMELFSTMRAECDSLEETVTEVLATILSSPHFLYVANGNHGEGGDEAKQQRDDSALTGHALATRLALFLWCSIPDDELLALAESGDLAKTDVLESQVERMLADPRSDRFAEHFVRQWLNLRLLDFLNLKKNVGNFDPLLKEAMQREPVELFGEIMNRNASVLDFIHCDYAMVNERLAQHYGLKGVAGNHFQPSRWTVAFDVADC